MNNDPRATKIHDFVAHDAQATCLRIGAKSGRVMVTGGEDRKVNLWAVGKTSPILSLGGHASSIECVTLDWPEEIVVAGSSSGTLKLWDLEHAKVIRTLAGHKSGARCVEFHPFGEFFASGSVDSSVKIWDIKRKGCIQTYQGHHDGVTVLRITPDGRWIATGGGDGVVKIRDMTAGKLLHSFSDHTGAITALAFNPSEFLIVTAGEDNVLRFYDLQTFECISKTPPISGRVQVLQFDPDGHELFVGSTDSLQIWTWEPAVCHDVIPVSWPNISDMRIMMEDGKVLAGALDHNFLSMWGVDITPHLSPTDKGPPTTKPPDISNRTTAQFQNYGDVDIARLHIADDSGSSTPRASATNVYEGTTIRSGQPFDSDRREPSASRSNAQAGNTPFRLGSASRSTSSLIDADQGLRRSASGNFDRGDEENRLRYSLGSNSRAGTPLRGSTASAGNVVGEHPSPFLPHGQRSSTATNPFVPAGTGERPLNLDVAKFIQNAQRRLQPLPLSPSSPGSPPSTSDNDIIDSLLFRHASVGSILNNRLTSIRIVRSAWDESNIRPTIESLVTLKDASVLVDVLRIINLKPKLLTMEAALMLLPLVHELFFEVYEDYIVTACNTVRTLVKSFGPVILATLDANYISSPGVDISREDRVSRCRSCRERLIEIATTLEELKRSAGPVGGIIRETLRDLASLDPTSS
ncbi:WD40-repeat-containing domain protein [Fimicolochytrium jonesii]|uniref:WD40-repeat-containing domain protein n=1 Tax=Fimicolochytrium jonesii TaxID=1396493 RepID=UPI0022FDCA6A|nr:WD40-repeat-containing domain protein [Fimicolochytrium jonesii]KAI8819538.1 WD40-repeat-containing domain protein [Fimicolochytrium jonesii]